MVEERCQDVVRRIDLRSPHTNSVQDTAWNTLAAARKSECAEVIFATSKSFLDASQEIRNAVMQHLWMPNLLLDTLYTESNGFCGCDFSWGKTGQLQAYTHWSRFIVKQTFSNIQPKRSFTRHQSIYTSNVNKSSRSLSIHTSDTAPYGWQWYEMWFFTYWSSPDSMTLMCLDVPTEMQLSLEQMFSIQEVIRDTPYSVFQIVTDELLRAYDRSIWSIRDHISQWEVERQPQHGLGLLHEISRYSLHVSETIAVARRSFNTLLEQHEQLRKVTDEGCQKAQSRKWDKIGNQLHFQTRLLQGLHDRSQANGARVQNEISLAFNTIAHASSQIQIQIGEEARKEAAAMKAIAVVTMTFLPATFISTLFGMNFFAFRSEGDSEKPSIVVTHQFWIFWALAAPLTVVTLAAWIVWNRRN